jgi:hypothetical protein
VPISGVHEAEDYAGSVPMLELWRAIQKARPKPVTYIQIAFRPGIIAISLLFNKVMATIMETVELCKPAIWFEDVLFGHGLARSDVFERRLRDQPRPRLAIFRSMLIDQGQNSFRQCNVDSFRLAR